MPTVGMYFPDHDVPSYDLPPGWTPVDEELLGSALDRAGAAWDGHECDRVRAYYDPDSNYAGNLLTAIPSTSDNDVDAADLLAVSTLNIQVHPRAARALLLEDSGTRRSVRRVLREETLPSNLPITSLDSEPNQDGAVLTALQTAYLEFRSARTDDGNAWVFAAKMCARKRPRLAPVRDNVVCELLNGGPLRRGGIGTFETDLQVFAYLMSSPLKHRLRDLRAELDSEHPGRLEASDLRLLDVVLWTKGIRS
jgi:hypothetical protein